MTEFHEMTRTERLARWCVNRVFAEQAADWITDELEHDSGADWHEFWRLLWSFTKQRVARRIHAIGLHRVARRVSKV